jgi:hypothetical protein
MDSFVFKAKGLLEIELKALNPEVYEKSYQCGKTTLIIPRFALLSDIPSSIATDYVVTERSKKTKK